MQLNQTTTTPNIREEDELQRNEENSKSIIRKLRIQKARRMFRIRRRLEREIKENSALPAPFVSIHIQDKEESMKANFLLILAILQCICGFVFPICDAFALTNTKEQLILHKYYMESFLLIQYAAAIVFLAYLQMLIYCYAEPYDPSDEKDDLTKGLQVENQYNGIHKHRDESNISRSDTCESFTVQTSLQRSATQTSNNQSKRVKLTWHCEGMNLYLRIGAVGFGLGVMIMEGFNLSSAWELGDPSCHSYLWIPKHFIRLVWILWQTYFIFKFHKAVFHVQKFAVRMAFTHLAVVNLCHWLQVVITEISETLIHADATTTNDIGTNVQEMFASQFTNYLSSSDGKTMLSFLNSSGIVNWTRIVDEFEHFNVASPYGGLLKKPSTDCNAHLGQTLKPFLFPLAIEYCLITGTLFYKMLQRVGQCDDPVKSLASNLTTCSSMPSFRLPPTQSLMRLADYDEAASPSRKPDQSCVNHTKYRRLLGCWVYLPPPEDGSMGNRIHSPFSMATPAVYGEEFKDSYCHRSHTGLFLGIMLFITNVIVTIFFLSQGKNTRMPQFASYTYPVCKIVMLIVSMIACLIAVAQTHQMKFRRIDSNADGFEYNLLGMGLIGCLAYHMLLFVPLLETIVHVCLYGQLSIINSFKEQFQDALTTTKLNNLTGTAIVYIAKSLLEILQASAQFFFIVEASRRGPCCRNQTAIKPGRSSIVFLISSNLTLWLMNTFEMRQAETSMILHRQYYGLRTWSVITCCFIPLIIFFRFHSTVCLAQIWSTLYSFK